MDIKPVDQNVKTLLTSSFYKIPRFQRPYSWEGVNVDDFWSDSVQTDEQYCFIGSFVVYRQKGKNDLLLVVDGQQRLTTITLLLAAIRDEFRALDFDPQATGLQKLIERPDINDDVHFVLQSETPYPYLQRAIQSEKHESIKPAGEEELRLKSAFELLRRRVKSTLAAIDADDSIAATAKGERKKDKLTEIRDRVLNLQLILITLDNDEDAYLIFETLNTRGMDLEVADLVKSHLTRLLKPKNAGDDTTKQKWEAMRDEIENADLDINSFLLHFWLSRYPYISKRKLFKEVKRQVDKASAKIFLKNLIGDAAVYKQALQPTTAKWKKEEFPIRASLEALDTFNVVQPAPLLLSLLREYRAGRMKLKAVARTLRSLEDFHVEFTAVTSQRTGGGTAQMYAVSARGLVDASGSHAKGQVLSEFISKLRERTPTYEEFEASFMDIRLMPKQRSIAKYLLCRIDAALRNDDSSVVDYERMTIEHIGPRSGSIISADKVNLLGNLLLMSEKANNAVGTKAFTEKKAFFAKNKVPMDDVLTNAAKWTDAEVQQRTKALAKILHKALRV